ncbi:putative endolysin [Edwardsiella phage pEt-SU]|uniref:Putative endolysin n=1 Tax=Edwardsiella phage pEt-SU TaxID=2562142 RepID=A0A4D6DX39_9CAUD|nr:tail fiber protein [Edwardsiella phage pEt-SU]QBZ70778.1 putative endolysin [Edwardsiella phage pEt-SU]
MKDDYEINWDSEDMFAGDYDFDMDFDMDPNAKKGFLGGFASGFLTGVTDGMVGTTDAKIRTLRTVLPSTWSTALDKAEFIHGRYQELKTEFQQENAQTFKSLQNIAGHLSEKMSDKMPNFVSEGINKFSEKDFSDWEKPSEYSSDLARMDDASDDEAEYAQDRALASQSSMFSSLSDSLNSMTAAATASLQSTIMGGNRQLVNIEGGVRDLLNYQRNVQARMDQAMLNLTARQYVQSSKFYKFMEAGVHEEIRQLKKILESSEKSDFEKTSTFAATKQAARDAALGAVGRRMGGLGEFMSTRFGKGARKDMYGTMGGIVDAAAMGLDMGVGEMSKGTIGDLLGQMVAGQAIEQLPYFFTHGPGKKMIDKLMKNNPAQAKWIRGQVKQLKDMGNVVSYLSTSGPGMVNRLAENYQAMDEMKFYDYDEYLQSLSPGEKPIPKNIWKVTNAASNVMKSKINSFMQDVGKSRGTQYTISKRDPREMAQPGHWKEMNNITLNEVIPGLISQTNQILEQIRTGRDDVEKVSYNYMRGQFMKESDRKVTTKADLMQHSDFKNIASAALEMADSLDTRKLLSPAAKKALALQIAKDVDAEKAFNPFYYLGDLPGVPPSQLKEIHAVMKLHFGIEDQDIVDFENGDAFTQLKMASKMPTRKGRERLATASVAAENLKSNYPNVTQRINLLRQTGNEQMLRDLGVIYTEGGVDKINAQMFHDRIGQYMDDPNNPELRGVVNGDSRGIDAPTRGLGLGGTSGAPAPIVQVSGQEELNDTLKQLNERLAGMISKNDEQSKRGELVNFDSMTGEITSIKDINQGILGKTTEMAETMSKFYEMAAAGKLLIGKLTVKEEREEEDAKLSIWKAVKSKFPKGFATKGMEFLANNSPLVLGGMLGGLSSAFISNPLLAAGVASAGLLAGGIVQYWGRQDAKAATGNAPSDDEDILNERGEPILAAQALKAEQYLDAVTRRVIKTWNDIKGPVYDTLNKVVIGVTTLSGKIFGPDGRAVVLNGLKRVKDAAVSAYGLLDPINRIKSAMQMGKDLIYQQDVYVRGDKEPRLLSIKFKSGEYFIRTDNNEFKSISGWNEINGPVYDEQGNQLVTQEEYEAGLITATGAAVRNVGAGAANMVGMATGLAKSGMDTLLGKLGYNKAPTAPGAAGGASGAMGSASGVERRLDRIYKLLEKQFGISIDDDALDSAMAAAGMGGAGSGGGSTGGNSNSSTSPFRLNSLSFKARQKEEEEKHKVNEAIISIAENTKGLGAGDGKDEKEGGIFSKLKGFIGGIATFGMNLIKNPIGTIGGLIFGSLVKSTERLGKIGKLLFNGVLGAASPIYKLMKWGFSSLAKAFMGGKMVRGAMDALDGPDVDVEQHGQSGKKKKGKAGKKGKGAKAGGRTRTPKTRGKFKIGNPMSMVVGTGLSWALGEAMGDDEIPASPTENADIGIGDRDPVTGHYRTAGDAGIEALTSWLPQGQLAKAAVDSAISSDTRQTLDNYGLFWSSDGKFFFNRNTMEKHEDEVRGIAKDETGYGLIKDPGKPSRQRSIRLAMYGIKDSSSPLGRRVLLLEKLLYPWVAIRGDRASLKPDTPIEKILTQFVEATSAPYKDNNAISSWYTARFKPIFLMYNAAISVARMGDLDEFDAKQSFEVVQVVSRVSEAIATMDPFPYNIDIRIDNTEGIMNEELTRHTVTAMFERLSKDFPPPDENAVEKIATDADTAKKLETQGTPTSAVPTHEQASQDIMGKKAALASQQAIDAKFQQPAKVSEIDISDMMPGGDQPMDAFVMTRLAAYGNIDNMPWRVAAVLRLERYMENFIMVMGDDARFTGKSGQVLELFKASFRLDTDIAINNWMTWFRDRFLPVLMTYVKGVKKYKGTMPSVGWKSLSATNRAQIAHQLTEQLVVVNDQQVSVWEIEASPFPSSKSGKWADRAKKYLEILDAKAAQARLRDPELEDMSSRTMEEKDPQKFAKDEAETKEKAKQTTLEIQQRASGSSPNTFGGAMPGFGGAGGQTAMSQGGYYPNATMSAPGGPAGSAGEFMGKANENFNPEFIKQAGEDKGVKMSLEQGEKLMLNHLVKAGFKDNKVLALALAMARKETGNYQNTVENTNWSAPTLLKYFKNVPDAATAQKVAAMSPAERAMWVYGRAPKGPQLGNSKPEDGWNYRGRGFFQLTGKSNYEKFKKDTGIDVVSNPKLVSEDPNVMAESAVWYLKNNPAMKSIAKSGDFDTAVRGINGGNAVPATDERRKYYNDYLNKLRSGDIDLGDTSGAADAADPDAADPMAGGGKAPTAADQNAPPEQVAGQTAVKEAGAKAETVSDILAKEQKPPSNVGSTASAGSASPLDPSTKGTAAADAIESSAASESGSSSATDSSSAPSTASAASAPAVKAPEVAPAAPQGPIKAEVALPDNLQTTDTTVAGILSQTNQLLTQLVQGQKKGDGGNVVDMR